MSFLKDLFGRNKGKKEQTVMPPVSSPEPEAPSEPIVAPEPSPEPSPEPAPAPEQGIGEGQGPGRQPEGFGAGPDGECVCSSCGAKVPHQAGIPCYEQKCPKCGQTMTRA